MQYFYISEYPNDVDFLDHVGLHALECSALNKVCDWMNDHKLDGRVAIKPAMHMFAIDEQRYPDMAMLAVLTFKMATTPEMQLYYGRLFSEVGLIEKSYDSVLNSKSMYRWNRAPHGSKMKKQHAALLLLSRMSAAFP